MAEQAAPDTPPARLRQRAGAFAHFLFFTTRRFYDDGMMTAASALTFSTLLALVPLLVIAFAIFSAFPAFDAVQERLQGLIFSNMLPETGEDLRVYINRFTANASELTAAGIVALVISAVLLLSTIEATLNQIWRVERERPILVRLLVFWTLLTLGPLLIGASFSVSSTTLDALREWAGQAAGTPIVRESTPVWMTAGLAALAQTLAFTVLFKLVPARPVRLKDAAIGGAVAGVAFEILKWGFQAYLTSGTTYQTIYGAVAAFPIFLIWTYSSWTVIIIGAVFAASLPDWRRTRQLVPVTQLSPPQELEAAVALLAILGRHAQRGGPVAQQDLAEAIPLAARDSLLERMRAAGYLVETAGGRVALSRDLHTTRLADLACDLGLSLGGRAGSDSRAEALRAHLPEPPARLAELLDRLGDAERDILDVSLAEVIAGGPRDPGASAQPVALKTRR